MNEINQLKVSTKMHIVNITPLKHAQKNSLEINLDQTDFLSPHSFLAFFLSQKALTLLYYELLMGASLIIV